MKTAFLPLLTLLAFTFAPLRAADDPRVEKLRAADDERVAAVVAADQARLTEIYADDLRYAHSTGAVDDKASYIDALATGRTKYLAWNYEERNFSFPGPDVAMMTGRTRIKVGKADGISELTLCFLGIWREEKGQWRFVAWQSCKLPEPVPAGK